MLVGSSVFADAEERCIVLLAENYGGTCAAPTYLVVDTFADLSKACSPAAQRNPTVSPIEGDAPWPLPLLSASERDVISRVRQRQDVYELGDVAKVRIGVVTGANDFFVLFATTCTPPGTGRRPRWCPSSRAVVSFESFQSTKMTSRGYPRRASHRCCSRRAQRPGAVRSSDTSSLVKPSASAAAFIAVAATRGLQSSTRSFQMRF